MPSPLMLQFSPTVSLEEVVEAVRVAYERAGCSPCGRLSLYLHAQDVVDPAISKLREMPSVINVAELGAQIPVATFEAG
jgi:hypothetical protein